MSETAPSMKLNMVKVYIVEQMGGSTTAPANVVKSWPDWPASSQEPALQSGRCRMSTATASPRQLRSCSTFTGTGRRSSRPSLSTLSPPTVGSARLTHMGQAWSTSQQETRSTGGFGVPTSAKPSSLPAGQRQARTVSRTVCGRNWERRQWTTSRGHHKIFSRSKQRIFWRKRTKTRRLATST